MAPILLLGLGGLLGGGAYSVRQQGGGRVAIGVLLALALLSVAAGVLWLLPGGDS